MLLGYDLEFVLYSGTRSAFQLFSLSRVDFQVSFNETFIRPITGLHRALFTYHRHSPVSVTRQYGHHPRHVEAREGRVEIRTTTFLS